MSVRIVLSVATAVFFRLGVLSGKLLPLGTVAGKSGGPAVGGDFGGTAQIFVTLAKIQVEKVVALLDGHFVTKSALLVERVGKKSTRRENLVVTEL